MFFFDLVKKFNGVEYYFISDSILFLDYVFGAGFIFLSILFIKRKQKYSFIASFVGLCFTLVSYTTHTSTKHIIVYNFNKLEEFKGNREMSPYLNELFINQLRKDYSYIELLKTFKTLPPVSAKDVKSIEILKNRTPNMNKILMVTYQNGLPDLAKNHTLFVKYRDEYYKSLKLAVRNGDIDSFEELGRMYLDSGNDDFNIINDQNVMTQFTKNIPSTCENAEKVYQIKNYLELHREANFQANDIAWEFGEKKKREFINYPINVLFALNETRAKMNKYTAQYCIDLYNKHN